MAIPQVWDEVGAKWDQGAGASWDPTAIGGAALSGALLGTGVLAGVLQAQILLAAALVGTGTLAGPLQGGVVLPATALLGTGTLNGILRVPSFPGRRRITFYWEQPIGPTHVRIF